MATFDKAAFQASVTARAPVLVARANDGATLSATQWDEIGRAAFRMVFPALYQRVRQTSLTPSSGEVTVTDARYVYIVETVINQEIFTVEWEALTPTVIRVPLSLEQNGYTVNLRYIAPILYPESGSVTYPDEFMDLLYLAAQIVLCEFVMQNRSQYIGYRPNENSDVDENELLNMHQSLSDRFISMRDERAMYLPPMPANAMSGVDL